MRIASGRLEPTLSGLFLILCILCLPLYHGGGYGLASPVSCLIWSILAVCCVVQLGSTHPRAEVLLSTSDWPLLTAVLLFGTSTLWRWESAAEPQLLLALVAVLFLYVSVRQTAHRSLEQFLWIIVAGGALQTIYAWLLFLKVFSAIDLRSTALVGGFLQPNVLASFLATALAAIGVLFDSTKTNFTSHRALALYIALFLISTTLVSIGSRTGWIAMSFVTVLSLSWIKPPVRLGYIVVITMSLALAIWLQSFIPELHARVSERFELTTNGRFRAWMITLPLILEKPWLGFGLDSFNREHVEALAAAAALQTPGVRQWAGLDHPHNFILNWWFTGGLGTLIAFTIMAGWHLWALSKIRIRERWFFLALMAPIYLHMQTEFPFRQSPLHILLVINIIALLSARAFSSSKVMRITQWHHPPMITGIRTLAGIAVVVLILEAWNSWFIFRATNHPDEHATDLQRVVFPITSQQRYEDAVAIVSMQRARSSGNATYYSYFADWAEKKIITTPRPEIYEALIEAHIALKNQASAKHFYEEMMYLFPTTKTQFKRQRIEPADE